MPSRGYRKPDGLDARAPTDYPKNEDTSETVRIVNVNTASAEVLDALPLISLAKAKAIIEGRPYSKPEDLLRVRGIGPATLDRIRPFIAFDSTNDNLQNR